MSADIIEQFLLEGGPKPPESRATKHDLERHIRERDALLESLRSVLLATVANKFAEMAKENKKKDRAIDEMTPAQLSALVGDPVPAQVISEFFKNSKEVCEFIDKIGAHRVLYVTSYKHEGQGQNYTVFYYA